MLVTPAAMLIELKILVCHQFRGQRLTEAFSTFTVQIFQPCNW